MKANEMKVVTVSPTNSPGMKRSLKNRLFPLLVISMLILSTNYSFAHCDTMNGPTIMDAKKAIDKNNVNYALKWVLPDHEKEIRNAFIQMMKVRGMSTDAKELSEKYFFETLVRIHRAGEGVPFTGVKPAGTPIDEKIMAADKSIELGNLSPLQGMVSAGDMPELTKRFEKVMSLKNFDVNNVAAGREYIGAYVQFFKFAEGEDEGTAAHGHGTAIHTGTDGHAAHIPWMLSGIFFITSIVFGFLFFKKK